MLDIKFLRENPDVVKQNIKNKFQDRKLPLVDQVIELDKENREIKQEVQALRADRNKLSKQIGALMGQGKKEEAEEVKKQVTASADRIEELSEREKVVEEKIKEIMIQILLQTDLSRCRSHDKYRSRLLISLDILHHHRFFLVLQTHARSHFLFLPLSPVRYEPAYPDT